MTLSSFSIPISFMTDVNGNGSISQVTQQAYYAANFVAVSAPSGLGQWTLKTGGSPVDFASGSQVTLGPAPTEPGEQVEIDLQGAPPSTFVTGTIWGQLSDNSAEVIGQLPNKASSVNIGSKSQVTVADIAGVVTNRVVPIPPGCENLTVVTIGGSSQTVSIEGKTTQTFYLNAVNLLNEAVPILWYPSVDTAALVTTTSFQGHIALVASLDATSINLAQLGNPEFITGRPHDWQLVSSPAAGTAALVTVPSVASAQPVIDEARVTLVQNGTTAFAAHVTLVDSSSLIVWKHAVAVPAAQGSSMTFTANRLWVTTGRTATLSFDSTAAGILQSITASGWNF